MTRRRVAVVFVAVVALLIFNALLVNRDSRAAEAFAGGHVLKLDGPDLNVREYGPASANDAIVLLHGYSASIEWWHDVIPALTATGRRVVAIDLVGHGGSEAPTDTDAYGAAGQASAVINALAELGLQHVTLVGHSMGGHVALAVAERKPDLVDGVAVSDTFGGPGLRALPILARAACWPVMGQSIDRFRHWDAIVEGSLQTGFAKDFKVPALAHRSLEQLTYRGVCKSKAGDQLNAKEPVADRLVALGKPVLVIWGDRDVLTPTATNVARYEKSGLKPHIIKGSGHSPMIEKPDAFLKVLLPFLASVQRSDS